LNIEHERFHDVESQGPSYEHQTHGAIEFRKSRPNGYSAMPFIATENAFMSGNWSGTQLARRISTFVAESCRFRLIRSRLIFKPQAFAREDTGTRNPSN
jgi:hypothetical protein